LLLEIHPAMRHAIGPQRELGRRTIFSLPTRGNPAGATPIGRRVDRA
jgi:anthranilate phosphoribosyltransferase